MQRLSDKPELKDDGRTTDDGRQWLCGQNQTELKYKIICTCLMYLAGLSRMKTEE